MASWLAVGVQTQDTCGCVVMRGWGARRAEAADLSGAQCIRTLISGIDCNRDAISP